MLYFSSPIYWRENRQTPKNAEEEHDYRWYLEQENFRIDFFFIFTNNLSVTKTVFPAKIKNTLDIQIIIF